MIAVDVHIYQPEFSFDPGCANKVSKSQGEGDEVQNATDKSRHLGRLL